METFATGQAEEKLVAAPGDGGSILGQIENRFESPKANFQQETGQNNRVSRSSRVCQEFIKESCVSQERFHRCGPG
jgi:hypothetical protein